RRDRVTGVLGVHFLGERRVDGAHHRVDVGLVEEPDPRLGAAVAASAAGVIRDTDGSYDLAWYSAGILCAIAALLSVLIRKGPRNMALTSPA
ncbi:hypothetical protein ACFQ1S_37680, partial [Kibdelosporangium lantanae]